MNVSYNELQKMKGYHVEIEYKGENMKYKIEDISPEFWSFLIRIGTINILESNDKVTEHEV